MARISGTWYIVIGLFIAIVSFIVWKLNDTRRSVMVMFFFIGIIFCIIGVVKLFREKEQRPTQQQQTPHQYPQQGMQQRQHVQHAQSGMQQRPPQHTHPYQQHAGLQHPQHGLQRRR